MARSSSRNNSKQPKKPSPAPKKGKAATSRGKSRSPAPSPPPKSKSRSRSPNIAQPTKRGASRSTRNNPSPPPEQSQSKQSTQVTKKQSTRGKRPASQMTAPSDNDRPKNQTRRVKRDVEPVDPPQPKVQISTSTGRNKGKKSVNEEEKVEEQPQKEIEEVKVSGKNKKVIQVKNGVSTGTRSGMVNKSPIIRILEVRVNVRGVNYSIWRTLYMTDEILMTKVARIIVSSMGWLGHRDWEFHIGGHYVVAPPDDIDDKEEMSQFKKYADEVELSEYNLKKGDKFTFNYGEDQPWVHDIVVENLHEVERNTPKTATDKGKSVQHAVIILGMGSVPDDDKIPKDYDKECEEWEKNGHKFPVAGFDPEKFDKENMNRLLRIHLYDNSKLDPQMQQEDGMFKY